MQAQEEMTNAAQVEKTHTTIETDCECPACKPENNHPTYKSDRKRIIQQI
jgi:hypothetical protein